MNANHLNLCPKCVHFPKCVLTHAHSTVLECSEFDEIQQQAPTHLLKITKRELALETI